MFIALSLKDVEEDDDDQENANVCEEDDLDTDIAQLEGIYNLLALHIAKCN